MKRPDFIAFPLNWDPNNTYIVDANNYIVGEWREPLYMNDWFCVPRGFGWIESRWSLDKWFEWCRFWDNRVERGMTPTEVLEALNRE